MIGYFKTEEDLKKYKRFFDFQVSNFVKFLKENRITNQSNSEDYTSIKMDVKEFVRNNKRTGIKLFQKKVYINNENLDKNSKKEESSINTETKKTNEDRLEAERKLWNLEITGQSGTTAAQSISEEFDQINTEASKRLIPEEKLVTETINEFKKRNINRGELTFRAKFGAKTADQKDT